MLTDEKLETMLRTAFVAESDHLTSPPGLNAAIRRRHTIARRRLAFAAAAPVVGVAVAVAATATISATPPSGETEVVVDQDPARIQLAGYTFTLPHTYGAREGSCELTLPDGTIHTGIPGTGDACLVLLAESFAPSWFSDPPSPGDWVVTVNDESGEFVVLTATGQDPATGRYFVLSVKQPRGENFLQIADLRKILDEGLARGEPS